MNSRLAQKAAQPASIKTPASDPVFVGEQGVQHDVIVDVANHGGVDQAVYIYGVPDYNWWAQSLGHDLAPGTFGENVTLTDLVSATLCVGDRLRCGDVMLQVTSPRIPCVTLATRMDDPTFVKKFVRAGRYGAYCRVLQTGHMHAGQAVTLLPYDGERVGINELADAFYGGDLSRSQLKRFLAVPIAIRARDYYKEKLAALA